MRTRPPRTVARAAVVGGVLSGAPSTLHALATGGSLLEATRAAGTILGHRSVVRGAVAHAGLSLGWASVVSVALPRRAEPAWGALAGGAIAALDLALARRRWPAVAALPTGPQVLDHIAFGALVGLVLVADRERTA